MHSRRFGLRSRSSIALERSNTRYKCRIWKRIIQSCSNTDYCKIKAVSWIARLYQFQPSYDYRVTCKAVPPTNKHAWWGFALIICGMIICSQWLGLSSVPLPQPLPLTSAWAGITCPGVAAFICLAAQAKPVRFESAGESAPHTFPFSFNPVDATGTQVIGVWSAEVCWQHRHLLEHFVGQ